MVIIVNYGMGNLGSILNMLRKIGSNDRISSDPADIERAEKLVLPGVGAIDAGMTILHDMNLIPVLNKKVLKDKTPILGICLGMQLMTKKSEEGKMAGLGWIDAETRRFKFDTTQAHLKIPHMGWNYTRHLEKDALFREFGEKPRFYFLHSYHVVCENSEEVSATSHYRYEFVSAIKTDNIVAVQFHPEKSHKYGMILLKNFLEWSPCLDQG